MSSLKASMAAAIVAIAATVSVVLAGCGFQPLHGQQSGASSARLAEVRVAPIADRVGQKLHNLLLDKLNPRGSPSAARYVLRIKLNESLQKLGVRKDDVATRANLVMRATFVLVRAEDDLSLFSASAVSINSYNILRSEFASLSAENDARARAVSQISDEIKTQIGIFLDGLK